MKIIYFFFFILFLNNVHGFGVSPGSFSIYINNGDEIEKEFFIYNNAIESRKYNISSKGFFNFTDFILEIEGNSERELKFLINIPYETLEGKYSGRVYINEINEEEGGVNLDTLLGIKFNFNVKSNYTGFIENNFEQKLELKEIQESNLEEFELEKEFGFEVVLFYILAGITIILCIYRIYKNIQTV